MIPQQEQADLDALKIAIAKFKLDCYDGQWALTRLTPEQLGHSGYKSIAEGLLYRVQSTQREIKRLTDAHIRKYPD